MKALDTAGAIDLAVANAAGFKAVGLYLNGNLSPQVAQQATDLDLGIWSIWEGSSSDPNGGGAQGRLDAIAATDIALTIRQPLGTAIYLPNDQIVTDWNATLDYFAAAKSVIMSRGFAPGFYGQTSVWDHLGYRYLFKAPDGTAPTADANIVQGVEPQQDVGGVTVDVDLIQTPEGFGGWNYSGAWPAPARPKGTEMIVARLMGTQGPCYLIGGVPLRKEALSVTQLAALCGPGGSGIPIQDWEAHWLDSIPSA